MSDITTKLERLFDLDHQIEIAEAALAILKAEKERLETLELPALFADARQSKVTLDNGATALRSLMARGSLPKEPDERQLALIWLTDHGYGPLIEAKVIASWSRGHRGKAIEEYQRLRGDNSAKVILDEGMHHTTLGKQMKDRIQHGLPVPMSLLGISIIPRVRFTKRGNGDDPHS